MVKLWYVNSAERADAQVRMDLQLYRVDDQNYLVDFRNVGYYPLTEGPNNGGATATPPTDGSAVAGSVPAGSLPKKDAATANIHPAASGVQGPFHFLEMACQLIAELASG